ncbi:RusA family crossover junction endodeoxyribonuclease [Deinococcus sp. Arct2-2]|uniref:RusA family crossover junction endodeoxyribonuclease n=1 Tax=Deinococcus sp. Arct2-2 TaxID=2568653 RepID=UPI0010A2B1BD|nr:RusA family crossover junction endodeoxyribonuclease [Deinococcus sp. Arct2-2]THF70479.1 RusA family crossover junction endodeoxyribonuclease [Deinococcus sp. Arct2-2]
MTALVHAQAWRARFPSLAHVERYLSTIADPEVRANTRLKLGLVEVAQLVPQTSPLVQPRPVQEKQPEWTSEPKHAEISPLGTLTFTLPYPPSLNSIWRSILVRCKPKNPNAIPYRVQVLLSEQGRNYRKAVISCVQNCGQPKTPPGARLALLLIVSPPDRRARDLSNIPKALEDALTHAKVWADDSLIDVLIVRRAPVHPGGRVVVQITPLTETLFGVE